MRIKVDPKGHMVICDQCGFKFHVSEVTRITNPDSLQFGLVVCKNDVDEVTPRYYKIRRELPVDPLYVRPERSVTTKRASNISDIEAGGVAQDNTIAADPPQYITMLTITSSSLTFMWSGGGNAGSSGITGYKIERESPVGGGFSTLIADTGNSIPYYTDTGLTASTEYNYRISTLNLAGAGDASNEKAATTS